MAILHGCINLSKIDKALITTNKNGEKVLWVDLYTYDKPDQYGNIACLATYDLKSHHREYLANFKPKELKKNEPSSPSSDDEELGF